MEFNDDQLKTISDFASMLLTVEEIAIAMDLDIDQFKEEYNKKEKIYRTINGPRIIKRGELNKTLIESAIKDGSSPAQQELIKLLKEIKIKDLS